MFPQFAQEGSFNQDHSIVHVASKVYLSQVDLTTTYCPGSKTKVAMVTPADHTGQHLIKTTQNDFAPPKVSFTLQSIPVKNLIPNLMGWTLSAGERVSRK